MFLAGCGVNPPALQSPGVARANASLESLPETRFAAADPRVGVMGRVASHAAEGLEFGYPGVTIRVCFRGARLWVTGSSNQGRTRLAAVYRGTQVTELILPQTDTELLVWEAPHGAPISDHCIDLVHLTETWIGVATLNSFRIAGAVLAATPFPQRKLLFIGDSVTCGEAVRRKPECSKDESWWDAYNSYGALTARALGAQFQLVCHGGRGVLRDWQGKKDVQNAPEFFSLAIPDERNMSYQLANYVPDGILVSLGTNDFNRALGAFPERREFVSEYVTFVRQLTQVFPAARIWLTEGAIVSDEDVGGSQQVGDKAAPAQQKTTLRSYLQEVAAQVGESRVRYLPAHHYPADSCDPHPTGPEHSSMARDVAEAIRIELGW
jgi:lysophospholipase L1-like esterase